MSASLFSHTGRIKQISSKMRSGENKTKSENNNKDKTSRQQRHHLDKLRRKKQKHVHKEEIEEVTEIEREG